MNHSQDSSRQEDAAAVAMTQAPATRPVVVVAAENGQHAPQQDTDAPSAPPVPSSPSATPTGSGPIGAKAVAHEPGMLFFGANRRSGTTWLASILNAHPELVCRNEGWILTGKESGADHWLDREAVRRWLKVPAAAGTYGRLLGESGAERAIRRGMIRELVKQAALAEGWKDYARIKWMGDKTTTHYCTQVEDLFDLFPDARFVYMLRDGRDVVVSDLFLKFRDHAPLRDFDLPLDVAEEVARARRFHYPDARGHAADAAPDARPVPLFGPRSLEHFTTNWVRCVAGGLRAKELYGDRFYEVRYETMVEHPKRTVTDLYAWLGVEVDEAFIDSVLDRTKFEKMAGGRKRGEADPRAEWRKGISGDWRNYFTQDDKDRFKRLAGELLIELDYERDLNW